MPGPYASIDSLPIFDETTQSIYVRATAYRDNGGPIPAPIENFVGVRVKVTTPTLAGIKSAIAAFASNALASSAADIADAAQSVTIFDPQGNVFGA